MFLGLGLILVLNIIFWIFGFNLGSIHLKDSFEYLNQAYNMKNGNFWYSGNLTNTFNNDLVSQRPPLYGIVILFFKSIMDDEHFVTFLQCLLGSMILFTAYKLIITMESKVTILLFAPILFFPTQFIYTNMIMSELLFQALIWASFYFLTLFILKPQSKHLVAFILFLTLAILTKPVWYLFWIPALMMMIYFLKQRMIKVPHLALILIPITAVFLICIHNYNQTGYFHYSSVKRTNMINYNVYLTLLQKNTPTQADSILADVYKQADAKGTYREYSEFIEGENMRLIKANIGSYFWLETKGIFNFFIDHGRFDLYCFFSMPPKENMNGIAYYYQQDGINGAVQYLKQFPLLLLIYLPLICLVNLFITICFILFLFNRKISFEIRMAAFVFVFYLAIITGPIGAARFRMPVYPILLFTLPFGMEKFKSFFTTTKA